MTCRNDSCGSKDLTYPLIISMPTILRTGNGGSQREEWRESPEKYPYKNPLYPEPWRLS
jgi:hypothetical protein